MEFDVVIVGAGPAGLSAACRLMQKAEAAGEELNVCIVEKGSEIGAHILSGAIFQLTALDELFPDWKERGAPVKTAVSGDDVWYLTAESKAIKVPGLFVPAPMHNEGNYVISLGELCRWLGEQAETMGVNIFPGFAAAEVIYEGERVAGVVTGDMGVATSGERKEGFAAGYELRARYTVFAEGCHGSLGKELMQHYNLRSNSDPQHYGIGLKEIWTVDPAVHQEGLVVHTTGWPLDNGAEGGGFLYHASGNQVFLGYIVALSYRNPHLNPFREFQRWKQHPKIRRYLEGGERVSYGARAINKGGLQSLPQLGVPGGLLAGCEAGFLNGAKIKGSHTAMKTGMLAAESIFAALQSDEPGDVSSDYQTRVKDSWVWQELHQARNFGPAQHKFGNMLGAVFIWLDQNIFRGHLPFTLHNTEPDHESLVHADKAAAIDYPAPDGKISFDLLSSVFLSSTNHEEDQPVHLQLADASIPLDKNLPEYDEPAQRYCPAGVYEIVEEAGAQHFRINAQNCVHCKTCDIKDPAQNINWAVPEGGGGPNYPGM
ncbi:MAG: electron transfer flavoprotein-ubiquinone oxidoreductase [Chromatiales bacterium]|jgi:electron-transferring-flavoprotein dehydrogenase|nr:electron transfer flavoprotein-ubiquinone oxidoreductase [Chromatiales bacterium]MDP6149961.1 electron transfer flavoprotein-ubiquinone oxidoreductase [Gammaproteobacteria bacterium]MDP7269914.1 electron transfer flavoprotein-ubiquinone oxidoreductase [Gammaproteobacteria bacterium]HJP04464.1 electron transfer flavoprotein-ubiquinone oxidoreductase [Gammaproteobacteria bacterium]